MKAVIYTAHTFSVCIFLISVKLSRSKVSFKNPSLYFSNSLKTILFLLASTNSTNTVALHRGNRTPKHHFQLPDEAGDAGFERVVGEGEAGTDVGAGRAVRLRQVHHNSAHREVL